MRLAHIITFQIRMSVVSTCAFAAVKAWDAKEAKQWDLSRKGLL